MDLELPLIALLILIFSAILHEIMHGLIAERLGDPTARIMGRITLNPIPHIDPMFSIILPLIMFFSPAHFIIGGAKPVPVDPFNLRDGRKDLAIVSLAGPITNLLIAIGFASIAHLLFPGMDYKRLTDSGLLGFIVGYTVYINLMLFIFNLFPIPPLDGSKVFALLLPEREANSFVSMGSMGFILVFGFLFLFGGVLSTLLTFALRLLGF